MFSRLVIRKTQPLWCRIAFRSLTDNKSPPKNPSPKGIIQPQVIRSKPGAKDNEAIREAIKQKLKCVDIQKVSDKIPSVQKIVSPKDLKSVGFPEIQAEKDDECECLELQRPDQSHKNRDDMICEKISLCQDAGGTFESAKAKLKDVCQAAGFSSTAHSVSNHGPIKPTNGSSMSNNGKSDPNDKNSTPSKDLESRYSACEQKLRLQKFISVTTFMGKLLRNDPMTWGVVKSVRGRDIFTWFNALYWNANNMIRRYFNSQHWAFTKECIFCSMILSHKLFFKKVPQWFNEVRQSTLIKAMKRRIKSADKQ